MLILVIIGCTALIIVCLGGGKKLGQIILGAAAIVGAIVVLGASGAKDIQPPQVTGFLVVAAVGAFFLLMFLRSRGVNWRITHMRHHDRDGDDPQSQSRATGRDQTTI